MRIFPAILTTIQWLALRVLVSIPLVIMLVVAGSAQVDDLPRFRSNGDLIAGWYWLRDCGHNQYAEYTFANPPTQGDILLDIDALATDRVNGGPKVNAVFDLLVGFPGARNMGGVFHRIRVTLPNVSLPGDPVGYNASGQIQLGRKILDRMIPASGELFIRIVRPENPGPHVAFRRDSIRIHNKSALAEGEASGEAQQDDGAVTEMHPELGDWGDEGQCFLDRPCIGDEATDFHSNGLPGAGDWYWMRPPEAGQYAEYRFDKPPATGDLIFDIAVLAQNRPDMLAKDTVHTNLTLTAIGSRSPGSVIGPIAIAIPSLGLGPDEEVWKARALVRLSRQQVDITLLQGGGLLLRSERIDEFEPDMAFSANSVLLYRAQDISR
ncbi:MAG: hypothetical protein R3D65_10270 [Zhengella sp.]|uniref:hypothetical protein n=1 Tax=Zhengella sp. TaxID=2282762 RepID=UPI0035279357|nr:hypothetical protein [Brucellaceae bacterium]